MGLSKSTLTGLRVFSPLSIQTNDLDFLEAMRFETDGIRFQENIDKKVLIDLLLKRTKIVKPKKHLPSKTTEIKILFDGFCDRLDKTLMIRNEEYTIEDIKWDKIDEFCNTLRKIERSDDRKVRWALYYLWCQGKTSISLKETEEMLQGFQIKDISKIIKRILKHEVSSGLVAEIQGDILKINHDREDKMVWHYLGDEIEELTRHSPGEIEKEILEMIDEGSFSATELSDLLTIDEATISRTLSKLRKNEKIVLSSFGNKGARYYTTNCDNCPFGTTKAACRKEALSFIIKYFQDYFGVDLTAPDFEGIEENQAILRIKRIIQYAKKEKDTKLERHVSEGLMNLFGTVVDKTLKTRQKKLKLSDTKLNNKQLSKLPFLFSLGMYKGAQMSHDMVSVLVKSTENITQAEKMKIQNAMSEHTKQFLRFTSVKEK